MKRFAIALVAAACLLHGPAAVAKGAPVGAAGHVYAVREFRRGPDYGDLIQVHGIVETTMESLIIADEHCPDAVIGLSVPDAVHNAPQVTAMLRSMTKFSVRPDAPALFVTLRVRPLYDAKRTAVTQLELKSVVAQYRTTRRVYARRHGNAARCS